MNRLTIQQKLRTGHVKRWQIVRVAREQTIAEHMYRVFLIADEIAREMKLDAPEAWTVIEWALMHDLPEVITGDIATPTKRAMREAVPDHDPIKRTELSLDEGYHQVYIDAKKRYPVALEIVKLADLMEAIDFLEIEGMGTHAYAVKEGLIAAYHQKLIEARRQFKEYDWEVVSRIYFQMRTDINDDLGIYPVTK